MDRSEAFRIIGVRNDASYEQIRYAYEYRLRKLNSADYDDERAYARRRAADLKEAFRLVTGENAPMESKFKIGFNLDVEDDYEEHDGECDHEQEAVGGNANIKFKKKSNNSDTLFGTISNNAKNNRSQNPNSNKKGIIITFVMIMIFAEVFGFLFGR